MTEAVLYTFGKFILNELLNMIIYVPFSMYERVCMLCNISVFFTKSWIILIHICVIFNIIFNSPSSFLLACTLPRVAAPVFCPVREQMPGLPGTGQPGSQSDLKQQIMEHVAWFPNGPETNGKIMEHLAWYPEQPGINGKIMEYLAWFSNRLGINGKIMEYLARFLNLLGSYIDIPVYSFTK